MGRKGRLLNLVLRQTAALALISAAGCNLPDNECEEEYVTSTISFTSGNMATKAADPDESLITDISLMVFDEYGDAEECAWLTGGRTSHRTRLIKGKKYIICACANFGYQVYADNIAELEEITYHLAYPDEYREGIPMCARTETVVIKDGEITLELERLMSKISLRIDRSRLSKNVRMDVRAVRVGNFPRYAKVMGPSRVTSVYDRFEEGFVLTADQCQALNETGMGGISGEASVYMLENMQGTFPGRISEDEEKVFDEDDPLYDLCSYLELEMDYRSADLISYDSPLLYRFYLGDGLRSLDVERNCHYHITVIPEDDGLSGGGWRVDKSGIGPSTPLFKMHPENYVEGHVGDTLRIWCECYPKTAPFDPGYEELNYDKSRGIYDYAVDDDGHGVTLYLKKAGTGIVYMSAGAPINQSGMVIVYVNP
jgi:hypothetical protein